jgi:O-antigen/teichoic acid export membrane protein
MQNLLNVASWDRIARVVLGIALMIVGFTGIVPGVWGIVVGLVGLIPLLTGLVGFCPLYFVFKFRTLKKTLTRSN